MCLNSIKARLESIYEIEIPQCIDDFLITDDEVLLDMGIEGRLSHERLLVRQQEDDICMSLYIDSDVYERVDQCALPETLWNTNPREFCLAAEGVSHFLYFCWNAGFTRQMTQLELELQAEVDKYLLIADCMGDQSTRLLHQWLFDAWEFAAELDHEQRDRYVNANHYAGKYCRRLEHNYLSPGRRMETLNELRRFYRKTQSEKIRMIDMLH